MNDCPAGLKKKRDFKGWEKGPDRANKGKSVRLRGEGLEAAKTSKSSCDRKKGVLNIRGRNFNKEGAHPKGIGGEGSMSFLGGGRPVGLKNPGGLVSGPSAL